MFLVLVVLCGVFCFVFFLLLVALVQFTNISGFNLQIYLRVRILQAYK